MSLAVSKVIDAEVTSKLSVADADVSAFYEKNPDQFKEGEAVHASHILFAAPQTATPADKQKARAKADAALKAIRAGGDFAAIARAQSQDPGSAKNGGDLGFFPKGQMDPAFEAAAFSLKPGTVSGVVETSFGFHIIKVVERRAARTMPLAEVAGQIEQYLTQQQRETMLNAFIEQAKAKAKIENPDLTPLRAGAADAHEMAWQVSQSWLIVLPSFVLWLSSWQRKQPGESMWPMLFG